MPRPTHDERLCCRRWLLLHARQSSIDACPTRCTGCPDRHRRVGKIRIVECPGSNEDQVRSRLGLAEERSAAVRAEAAVHSIPTVRRTREVTRPPSDLERRHAKAGTDRSTACAQVLAIAAPAHPRGDWRFRALPANRTAKTPACDCHCALQVGNEGLLRRASYACPLCGDPAMPPNPFAAHRRATAGVAPVRSNVRLHWQ